MQRETDAVSHPGGAACSVDPLRLPVARLAWAWLVGPHANALHIMLRCSIEFRSNSRSTSQGGPCWWNFGQLRLKFATPRPLPSQLWPKSINGATAWATFAQIGPNSTRVWPNLAMIGEQSPKLERGPTLADSAKIRPIPTKCCRPWSKSAPVWPIPARSGLCGSKLGQIWSTSYQI